LTTNVTPIVLQAGATLTVGNVVYITGAVGSLTIIKRVVFTNITAGVVFFTAVRTPFGGAGLEIIFARSLPAGGSDLAPELSNMVLNAGDTISAVATAAASIHIFASGFISS
jgi:hypothetical protein